MKPIISVCLPVYNGEKYIQECLDSILAQSFQNFELIIVDDGSTDHTVEIVKQYADPRIRLIQNKHNYIESLNLLLKEAQGKYIARMDADDIMVQNRLQRQYEYLETHPKVDLLAGSMSFLGKENHKTVVDTEHGSQISLETMLKGCCISHPTVMLRTETFRKSGLQYESEYIYAEDYRLWIIMLQKGMILHNVDEIFISYRQSDNQVSCRHSKEQQLNTKRIKQEGNKWLLNKEDAIKKEAVTLPITGNELSVIIPFLNEKEEVRNTIESIRSTVGEQVDIIVLDDASDDDYDYLQDIKECHVSFIRNEIRIGAAATKNKGVRLATTPYVLIIDAHMRFYGSSWLSEYLSALKENGSRIICCQTKALKMEEDGTVSCGEHALTKGAYLSFDREIVFPSALWNTQITRPLKNEAIPCILGATYATSKDYWNKIKGLDGLIHYGSEESYLSMKAWLEGGGCYFLANVTIGHIYRTKAPYVTTYAKHIYNNFFIAEVLFPAHLKCLLHAKCKERNAKLYQEVCELLSIKDKNIENAKKEIGFLKEVPFEKILQMNDLIMPDKKKLIDEESRILPAIRDMVLEKHDLSFEETLLSILFLCDYTCLYHDPKAERHAESLLSDLISQTEKPQPISFSYGICGLGWLLLTLESKKVINNDITDLLAMIDERVMTYNPVFDKDKSLETGSGGVIAYCATRRYLSDQTAFTKEFMDIVKNEADRMKDKSSDWRCVYFSMLLLSKKDIKACRFDFPNIMDIYVFPQTVPKNPKYWKPYFKKVTLYGINLLKQKSKK